MPNIQDKGATRGFYPVGAETGNKAIFENKESFSYGVDGIPEDFLQKSNLVAQNIYPEAFDKTVF